MTEEKVTPGGDDQEGAGTSTVPEATEETTAEGPGGEGVNEDEDLDDAGEGDE